MVEESDWSGLLNGMRTDEFDVEIDAILIAQASQGGSRPFQVRSTEGNVYWVKPPDNPQGQRVPVNEQIVGRCGALIGAPVCQVARV